ncbi:hypothetical protein ACFLUK_00315 [Chloroflexota bacterium]
MNSVVFRLLLSVLVIVSLMTSPGCRRFKSINDEGIESFIEDAGEGYKTITVITEQYSFSFEYSTFYEKVGPEVIDPEFTIPDTFVSFRAPETQVKLIAPSGKDDIKTVTTSFIPAHIAVHIYDPTFNGQSPSYNSTDRMNKHLEGESGHDNFKLIDRKLITVAGIEADYAKWEVGWFNLFAEKSDEPPLEYRWNVYFDYKGLIWWIKALSSGPEYRDRIDADFEHILETFKILD